MTILLTSGAWLPYQLRAGYALTQLLTVVVAADIIHVDRIKQNEQWTIISQNSLLIPCIKHQT